MKDKDLYTEQLAAAKKLIDTDIRRHHTIEDIAQKVAMGKTNLKQGFRIQYKMGLYSYLRKARMDKAMQLVTETTMPFKQVAKACGFRYSSNFFAAFTKYHSITPGKARK